MAKIFSNNNAIFDDLIEEVSKHAARNATNLLVKLAPESFLEDTEKNFDKEFSKYVTEISKILKQLDTIEKILNDSVKRLVLYDQKENIKNFIKAQTILNKAYTLIFSLRKIIKGKSEPYHLVFSDTGSQKNTRIFEANLKDLFPMVSLYAEKNSLTGEIQNIKLRLANIQNIQKKATQLKKRIQTDEEKDFAKFINIVAKKQKVSLARAAELGIARKYDKSILEDRQIVRDTAAARTMSDVSQYTALGAGEVKYLGQYGEAGLISLISLKQDLNALLIVLSKNKWSIESKKVILNKIFDRKTYIYDSTLKFLKESSLKEIKNL